MGFTTKELTEYIDDTAPDGSEIRLLPSLRDRGGLCHVTLRPGRASQAVRHQTVEEIWFFVQGKGEVWRKLEEQEETIEVRPGISLTIPIGTHFQFRNTGEEPLCFLCVTMPPWPGKREAVSVDNYWSLTAGIAGTENVKT